MASVVNIRKAHLREQGYVDLQDWLKDPKHLYIGREMSFYVAGAKASKWMNPYPVKQYGLEKSLQLYEAHVRKNLYDQLDELDD